MKLGDNGVANRAQLLSVLQEEFAKPKGRAAFRIASSPDEATTLLETLESLRVVILADSERCLVHAKIVSPPVQLVLIVC